MADQPICPCNGAPSQLAIFNPPGRDRLDYRIGDFVTFRHALLRSLVDPPLGPESELGSWKPDTDGDFGVQMVEWWAYLADILAFYNERIANRHIFERRRCRKACAGWSAPSATGRVRAPRRGA